MEHFFRKKLNAGYVALQQRILSLLNSSAKERYEGLLKQYPSLFQKVPKTLIAAYLGVSRETLSRLNHSSK
jgi:CRP-like cAMP-binding protein